MENENKGTKILNDEELQEVTGGNRPLEFTVNCEMYEAHECIEMKQCKWVNGQCIQNPNER